MRISTGRTLFYGKGDVLVYRTYAKPLALQPLPESPYIGTDNVIFAHNVTFSVSGDALLASFTEGDNALIVATDSMKNFILRHAAVFEGNTAEGFLRFVGERFFARYAHIDAIEIESESIPFLPLQVPGPGGFEQSGVVFRRSHNDRAGAKLSLIRGGGDIVVASHRGMLNNLQLIKVSGSSFHGFVRDEYTTLPDSYDRPLFIFLNIYWAYADPADAFDGDAGRYAAAEQIRDIAHTVFHQYNAPSIQHLIYRIGLRMLERFPQLAEVGFESNNRTWETVVDPGDGAMAGVFTEPRPPYGFQGFAMTREDLAAAGEAAGEADR